MDRKCSAGFNTRRTKVTKEEAIIKVLKVLKSPMLVMSPAKQEALDLCVEHGIVGVELIQTWEKISARI
jgi:hypothetical protein